MVIIVDLSVNCSWVLTSYIDSQHFSFQSMVVWVWWLTFVEITFEWQKIITIDFDFDWKCHIWIRAVISSFHWFWITKMCLCKQMYTEKTPPSNRVGVQTAFNTRIHNNISTKTTFSFLRRLTIHIIYEYVCMQYRDQAPLTDYLIICIFNTEIT